MEMKNNEFHYWVFNSPNLNITLKIVQWVAIQLLMALEVFMRYLINNYLIHRYVVGRYIPPWQNAYVSKRMSIIDSTDPPTIHCVVTWKFIETRTITANVAPIRVWSWWCCCWWWWWQSAKRLAAELKQVEEEEEDNKNLFSLFLSH